MSYRIICRLLKKTDYASANLQKSLCSYDKILRKILSTAAVVFESERGSEGARERGSEGERERGSEGARERGSEGARERGSVISGDGWFYDFGDSNRAFKRDCTVYTGY